MVKKISILLFKLLLKLCLMLIVLLGIIYLITSNTAITSETALFIGGIFCFFVGFCSVGGHDTMRTDTNYLHMRSMSAKTNASHMQDEFNQLHGNFASILFWLICGIILMAIAFL